MAKINLGSAYGLNTGTGEHDRVEGAPTWLPERLGPTKYYRLRQLWDGEESSFRAVFDKIAREFTPLRKSYGTACDYGDGYCDIVNTGSKRAALARAKADTTKIPCELADSGNGWYVSQRLAIA